MYDGCQKGGEETRKVCYRQNPDIEKNIELQSSTALVECVMADNAMPATIRAASKHQACSLGTHTTVLITLQNSCPKFNALKVVINTATACFSHDPSNLECASGAHGILACVLHLRPHVMAFLLASLRLTQCASANT